MSEPTPPPAPRLDVGTRLPTYAVAAASVVALVTTAVFVARHAWSLYDDAYIYLRYAENVLAGHGFRWNIADAPVEGFTGPAYLLLLVALGAAGLDLEVATQLLGLVFVTAAISVAAWTAATLARRNLAHRDTSADSGTGGEQTTVGDRPSFALPAFAAVLAGAALSLDHFFLLNSVIGLETALASLLVCGILASVTCLEARGLRTLLVLAVLTRPEAALFGLGVIAFPFARRPRWLAPLALAAVAIAATRWFIFGDIVPNTFHAKSGGTAAHARLGLEYIGTVVTHFPAIVLAPLALLGRRTRRPAAWFLALCAVWFAHFLRTGGDFFPFSRLAVPLVPALTALAATGVALVVGRTRRPKVMVAAVAITATLAGAGITAQWRAHRLAPMHGFDDVLYWTALGHWLGENHPDARFATTTIGAMGYFSGLHVYDLVGLTQPEVARDGEPIPSELVRRNYIGHERHNTAWIIAQRPDLIVFERDSAEQWTSPETARASYYAEWALLQEVISGRLPYRLYSPEIMPGTYALLFVSPEYAARRSAAALEQRPQQPGD
jgi:hypothetical protein